jgi:hypothetical protein
MITRLIIHTFKQQIRFGEDLRNEKSNKDKAQVKITSEKDP